MKAKITLTICIGFTALILTAIMFTQFKTVDQTDITAIETMREAELRTELTSWKTKYEDIETKIEERDSKIKEYKQELNNGASSLKLLEDEIKEAENYLGYTDLQGQGIVVTLKDTDIYNIENYELLKLVNELNIAGAEAISINDQRIVSSSDITLINNRIILVNTKKISGPYTVKAIGDKQYFESALTIKGGYIDDVRASGRDIEYRVEDNIVIPAYEGELSFQYAKEVVKEKEVKE